MGFGFALRTGESLAWFVQRRRGHCIQCTAGIWPSLGWFRQALRHAIYWPDRKRNHGGGPGSDLGRRSSLCPCAGQTVQETHRAHFRYDSHGHSARRSTATRLRALYCLSKQQLFVEHLACRERVRHISRLSTDWLWVSRKNRYQHVKKILAVFFFQAEDGIRD